MKTTQEERDAFRSMVDDAEGDVVVVIGDHLHIKPQLGVSIFMQLLDDADRCAELEETYLRLLTADRDAALARVKELEEGLTEYLDDWSCWDDQVFMNNELRALLNPKDGDR